MTITIRAEKAGDAQLIERAVQRAYADVAYSDHREHLMVERLRETEAFIPALSLLAEKAGEVVGHILLMRASIVGEKRVFHLLALAPLSVVPEHQGQGVGKRLIVEAHMRAAKLGFSSIVLVGIPGYYHQFGYEPLSGYPITLPFEAPSANCMILPLTPDALNGVSGQVQYPAGWLDH
ncbi:MAG: GNAT family N-acetyltransferase [Caulobacteraceae bacterium]